MPSAILKRNLESINVELSDKQIEQLDKYYEILVEWNSFYESNGNYRIRGSYVKALP